ncbi:hypothetical protein [Spongiimicrobium salis]|uniref:hypothetical protein n=1 Tax=Spongiimicrobium salis TaxID=1667022 RepID=UPI00374CA23E
MESPSIQQIKNNILAEKDNFESLNGLDSTSNVALYRLWAFVIATVMYVLYEFLRVFTIEMDQRISEQKLFTTLWFRSIALDYRHGHPLLENGINFYNDEGYTAEEIANAMIVARSAVVELEIDNRNILFIKVAKETDGELEKLSAEELQGLREYFERIKPAGTKLQLLSERADDLRLTIDFYYDPLVLTSQGVRIDGTNNTPVQDAIREYLKNLRFNGEFNISQLEGILRALEGCANRDAYVEAAAANYQVPENFQSIDDFYIANSGYMGISDDNLTINFRSRGTL